MSEEKIQFYSHPFTRGRIVHWMLEEAQANYEMHVLDIRQKEHRQPEYLRINPMGKIPAIVHEGVVVTESAAICAYLADIHPQAQLAPPVGSPLRGTYYRWLFFTASPLEYAVFDRQNPRVNPPERTRIGYGTFEETIDTLEKAVEKGFVVGNRFSAADVLIGSALDFAVMGKSIELRPAFTRYLELCHARPAYQRFVEQANALAPRKA